MESRSHPGQWNIGHGCPCGPHGGAGAYGSDEVGRIGLGLKTTHDTVDEPAKDIVRRKSGEIESGYAQMPPSQNTMTRATLIPPSDANRADRFRLVWVELQSHTPVV